MSDSYSRRDDKPHVEASGYRPTSYSDRAHDPYVQPNGVLKNLLGITDGHKLAAAEGPLTANRIFELYKNPIPGNFDLDHLKAIHRHIAQDIVDWAGQTRTIRIAKSDTEFCHPTFIESSAKDIFDKLATDRKSIGDNRDQFIDIATQLHGELNALHAFREYSGRSQRLFIDHVAREHGFSLDWTQISRELLIQNSILQMAGIDAPMRGMLDRITTRIAQQDVASEAQRAAAVTAIPTASLDAQRQRRRIR